MLPIAHTLTYCIIMRVSMTLSPSLRASRWLKNPFCVSGQLRRSRGFHESTRVIGSMEKEVWH
jgi:hypothetical protein